MGSNLNDPALILVNTVSSRQLIETINSKWMMLKWYCTKMWNIIIGLSLWSFRNIQGHFF